LVIIKAIVFEGAGLECNYVVKYLSKNDIFLEISLVYVIKLMGKKKVVNTKM